MHVTLSTVPVDQTGTSSIERNSKTMPTPSAPLYEGCANDLTTWMSCTRPFPMLRIESNVDASSNALGLSSSNPCGFRRFAGCPLATLSDAARFAWAVHVAPKASAPCLSWLRTMNSPKRAWKIGRHETVN